MTDYIETFARVEHKYILPIEKYDAFFAMIQPHIKDDVYPSYSLHNIYYDSPDNLMIRRSLEGPAYKEKLRLRAYGEDTSDKVFLEIKKKFDGIVYKRRIALHEKEAYAYLNHSKQLENHSQIAQEIDYVKNQYNVRKKMFIGYDRRAYTGIQEEDVRITFDTNIRYRLHNLSLNEIGEETVIQNPNEILLEIKVMDRYPIWLSNALSEMKLYKNSFSKYGIIYEALQNKERNETNIVLNHSKEVLQTCSLLY